MEYFQFLPGRSEDPNAVSGSASRRFQIKSRFNPICKHSRYGAEGFQLTTGQRVVTLQ